LAKPFKTHYIALDIDVYLRIAPETYLKECVVGGIEKVFENRSGFSDEGMDPSHLQDFTMAEPYVAYWNFEDNMKLRGAFCLFIG
jgi:lysyl-tRNA synthetase class 2